jgi:cold shock CspA family protein
MQTTVKWFNTTKGYGFLENGAGPDIYVNAKELPRNFVPQTGDIVEFECHVFDQKLVARSVRPVGHNLGEAAQPVNPRSRRSAIRDPGDFNDDNFGNRSPIYHREQQPHFVMR